MYSMFVCSHRLMSFLGFALLTFVITFLPGCEADKNVSLPEAGQTELQLKAVPDFKIPPRTIDDFMVDLSRNEQANHKIFKALKQQATLMIPEPPDTGDSWKKYMAKAESARILGLYEHSIKLANQVANSTQDPEAQFAANFSLGAGYELLGDYEKTFAYHKRCMRHVKGGGRRIIVWSCLAFYKARFGDLAGAKEAIAQANSYMPEFTSRNYGLKWIPVIAAVNGYCNATVDMASGEFDKAEQRLRVLVKYIEEELLDDSYQKIKGGLQISALQKNYQHLTFASYLHALSLMRLGRLAEAETVARETALLQAKVFGRYSGQTIEGLKALVLIWWNKAALQKPPL